MQSCQGTETAVELKYKFKHSICFFAAVPSRLGPIVLSTLYIAVMACHEPEKNGGWHFLRSYERFQLQDIVNAKNYEEKNK